MVLRFVSDHDDPRTGYARPAWNVMGPRLEPELRRVVSAYGMQNPRFAKAMFARLAAGAVIDRHRDTARGNLFTHKIHLPIRTSPDVMFEVDGQLAHLAAGRAYEVNNLRPHGARNPTDAPRIHFIFEVFDEA